MEEQRIVALSIDKVQTFLTEVIHSHTQEKQKEEETLSKIKKASREISADFVKAICEEFPEAEEQVLLSCSGVHIFKTKLPEKDAQERINRLFVRYYLQSGGQKLLRGVCFAQKKRNEIDSIQHAKKLLKANTCITNLIAANKEILFSFQQAVNTEERTDQQKTEPPDQETLQFAQTINKLYDGTKGTKDGNNNPNHFRIAVIKADLDGMGDMFRDIKTYEEYWKISDTLNRMMSLTGLHRAAKSCGMAAKKGWLFPFYIAGDDIFFAVEITDLVNGINVCRELLRQVKKELSELATAQGLSVSIGVDITFNREPIRYYMERVEEQLRCAKKAPPLTELKDYCQGKIAIFNMAYYDINFPELEKNNEKLYKVIQDKRGKESTLLWQDLLDDLCLLDTIRGDQQGSRDQIGTAHFFNALLQRLTENTVQSNRIKYANCLLYHLLPQYLDCPDKKLRERELTLHYNILRQINRLEADPQNSKKNKNFFRFNWQTEKRLEAYLRMMLLFSDHRFDLSKRIRNGETPHEKDFDDGKVRKVFFNRTVSYLYESILHKKHPSLCSIFIQQNPGEVTTYRVLRIDSSMFFKLRNTTRIPVEKAADMIELNNSETAQQVEEHNGAKETEGKLPNRLFYDKDRFSNIANRKGEWTPDLVDSIMLFYAYRDASIRFKVLYPQESKGGHTTCKK